MTQEEKAKAYDEAIEKAEKALSVLGTDKCEGARQIFSLFPELAESEDERIRKHIISVLEDTWQTCKNIDYDSSRIQEDIAWLEKQGEKPMKFTCTQEVEVGNGNIKALITKDYNSIDPHFAKPIDKVEPKFKNGQWIAWQNKCYKVNYNGCGYELIDQNGLRTSLEYGTVDKSAHLFTIQDAKDGDVLADYFEAYDNPLIFILKKFEHVNFGLVRPSDYSSYCFLTAGDIQKFKEGTYHHKHNIKPATKEQCDILFTKMKEAGYEWDAKKKELKEIHIIDEGKAEIDYCFTKMMNGEKVNSAWSEEDIFKVQRICKYLNEAKKYYADITEVRECMEWLKSLKDRVGCETNCTTTKEWSEEDNKWIESLIQTFEDGYFEGFNQLKSYGVIDWLKSLKGRYTWKPSDKQMEALSDINCTGCISYAGQGQELINLYNELKKLKG